MARVVPVAGRIAGNGVWRAVALLGCLAVLSYTAAAAALKLPRPYCAERAAVFRGHSRFLGIMDNQVVTRPAYLNCTLGILAAEGVGYYRTPMLWQYIETSPGVYDWSAPDALMSSFAAHRMTWLPILLGAPTFDRVVPVAAIVGAYSEPSGTRDFSQFVAAAVRRYGPKGSFWRQHPRLPKEPIRAWQIWNEPNLPFYWQPAPSAPAYTRLLRAAGETIKRLDPGADVVTAGMAFSARGVPALKYYGEMYRAGARGAFSSLAVHPYAPSVKLAIQRVESIRALMDRYRDRRSGVFISEFGWSSGGPASPYRAASPGAQAAMTGEFLRWIETHRLALRLTGAAYTLWQDERPASPSQDYWGLHMGLLNARGQSEPVFGVVMRAARKLDG